MKQLFRNFESWFLNKKEEDEEKLTLTKEDILKEIKMEKETQMLEQEIKTEESISNEVVIEEKEEQITNEAEEVAEVEEKVEDAPQEEVVEEPKEEEKVEKVSEETEVEAIEEPKENEEVAEEPKNEAEENEPSEAETVETKEEQEEPQEEIAEVEEKVEVEAKDEIKEEVEQPVNSKAEVENVIKEEISAPTDLVKEVNASVSNEELLKEIETLKAEKAENEIKMAKIALSKEIEKDFSGVPGKIEDKTDMVYEIQNSALSQNAKDFILNSLKSLSEQNLKDCEEIGHQNDVEVDEKSENDKKIQEAMDKYSLTENQAFLYVNGYRTLKQAKEVSNKVAKRK